MKKGAIFDMDGLLFDTERIYQENWLLTAREFGFEPHPDFPRAICGTCGAYTREVIRSFYPSVDAEVFLQSCLKRVRQRQEEGIDEKPGVHEILSFFQEHGVRLAVASSSALSQIKKNLSRAGILSCFDAVVSGDDVTRGKPEPDIFLEAARRLGLPPKDCYVFEDGINGILAGARAGCAAVMIPDLLAPDERTGSVCAGIYDSLLCAMEAIVRGEL